MKKLGKSAPPRRDGQVVAKPRSSAAGLEASFSEVVNLIQHARQRAFQAVNTELIDLYWQVGEYISYKLEIAMWGEGVVDQLARYIARKHQDIRGFTRASLFRMRQFYETYRNDKKVSPLVRQLSWTNNLLILSRCKRSEEREFYLRLAHRERWSKRDLECQLASALFERTVLSPPKVSPVVAQLRPEATEVFKDIYLLDFLDLRRSLQRKNVASEARSNAMRSLFMPMQMLVEDNRIEAAFNVLHRRCVRTLLAKQDAATHAFAAY
jgi:predicted nuclease of restriction endonuclease-like (RecB) superfamily